MKRSFALLVTLVLLASFSVGCLGDEETPYNQGAPGDFKYEFLQDDPYPNLIIELDYVTGRDMSSSARNLLNQRIKDVTDKDDIQWKKNSFNSEDDSYTVKELLKLEEQHRTEYKGGNNAVLHIFYLNGEFENANAAGVTYTGSSIVLFKDQFESVGTISAEDIEEAVLIHEFGHILGLVNIGYQSNHDHEDPEHPHHSNNRPGFFNDGSVMWWQIETINGWTQINGDLPNDFDSMDRDDLRGLKNGEL